MTPPRVSRVVWIALFHLALAGCVANPPRVAAPNADEPPSSAQENVSESARAQSTPQLASSRGKPTARPGKQVPRPDAEVGADSHDLWDRLRQRFILPIPDQPKVQRELEWYASKPDYLRRVQERARPYLHFIVEEIESRNLPGELALLPVVESAFQPFAYSPGSAAGIWQFIPSTGRLYGLRQDWWYDGRRDVVASTRAALDFLEDMSERFDGDWELALASYNAGAGTVSRAIDKNERMGRPTDFWSLDLPAETSSYVPRLLAIAELVADPEAYGISLVHIPDEPYFASVDTGSQLDLTLAAELAGMDIDELYLLNPGFNHWATDPAGPHKLQIPLDQAERFRKELAGLEPEKRLRWKRYHIRRGDTLGEIAGRNRTSVAMLREVNQLSGNRIRAGKYLLIPMPMSGSAGLVASAGGMHDKARGSSPKSARTRYVVQPGDTLWEIARDHKVDHKALAKWNRIALRDVLRPGQELSIWRRESQPVITGGVSAATLDVKPTSAHSSLTYRVRKGDSLFLIARKFNVSVAELRNWNTLSGKYLQPGQKLVLYVDVTDQQAL